MQAGAVAVSAEGPRGGLVRFVLLVCNAVWKAECTPGVPMRVPGT